METRYGSRTYAVLPGTLLVPSGERLIPAAPWADDSVGICCRKPQLVYFIIYGLFFQLIWAQEFLLMTPQRYCASHLRPDCSSIMGPSSGVWDCNSRTTLPPLGDFQQTFPPLLGQVGIFESVYAMWELS